MKEYYIVLEMSKVMISFPKYWEPIPIPKSMHGFHEMRSKYTYKLHSNVVVFFRSDRVDLSYARPLDAFIFKIGI